MSYQRHAKQHLAVVRFVRYALVLALVPALWFIAVQFVPKHTHISQDSWDPNCIHEYPKGSGPTRAAGAGEMNRAALSAANALLDLEYAKFDILSDCINPVSAPPNSTRVKVGYRVLTNSGWTRSKLIRSTQAAARVYAQCGITFDDVEVTFIEVKDSYKELDWAEQVQLVAATSEGTYPYLYFIHVQDSDIVRRKILGAAFSHGKFATWAERNPAGFEKTTGQPAKYADEIGLSNIALIVGHPYTSTDRKYGAYTDRLGTTIAHELYHLYGNCSCHSQDPGNFMYAAGTNGEKIITSKQCRTARNMIDVFAVQEIERREALGENW